MALPASCLQGGWASYVEITRDPERLSFVQRAQGRMDFPEALSTGLTTYAIRKQSVGLRMRSSSKALTQQACSPGLSRWHWGGAGKVDKGCDGAGEMAHWAKDLCRDLAAPSHTQYQPDRDRSILGVAEQTI